MACREKEACILPEDDAHIVCTTMKPGTKKSIVYNARIKVEAQFRPGRIYVCIQICFSLNTLQQTNLENAVVRNLFVNT